MASGREEAQGSAEDARRGGKDIEEPILEQANRAATRAVYFAASAARAASLIASPCGLLAMSTSVSGTNAETGVPLRMEEAGRRVAHVVSSVGERHRVDDDTFAAHARADDARAEHVEADRERLGRAHGPIVGEHDHRCRDLPRTARRDDDRTLRTGPIRGEHRRTGAREPTQGLLRERQISARVVAHVDHERRRCADRVERLIEQRDDLRILERVDAHERRASGERLALHRRTHDLVELLDGGEPLIAAGREVRVELSDAVEPPGQRRTQGPVVGRGIRMREERGPPRGDLGSTGCESIRSRIRPEVTAWRRAAESILTPTMVGTPATYRAQMSTLRGRQADFGGIRRSVAGS
jgi:hypothetical protein